MWIKDRNGQWNKKEFIFNSQEFERTFTRLKTYAKCVNASTYSVTNQLDNIYSDILYQHGFYVEFLDDAPSQLIISNVLLEKGKMYNLSITHTRDVIVNNPLDYQVTEEDGILTMSIRTAIALNYIKAANSLLFESDCGFTYWEDYVEVGEYESDDPNFDCYQTGTNGVSISSISRKRLGFIRPFGVTDGETLYLKTAGNAVPNFLDEVEYVYDDFTNLNSGEASTLYFGAFSSITDAPREALQNPTGNIDPSIGFQILNKQGDSSLNSNDSFADWYNTTNVIANDYTVVFTSGAVRDPNLWSLNNQSALADMGVGDLTTAFAGFNTGEPFYIIGRKGQAPGNAIIQRGTQTDILEFGALAGTDGTDGTSGELPGTDGTSGTAGEIPEGTDGTSGTSGEIPEGTDGTSGTSGELPTTSGTAGESIPLIPIEEIMLYPDYTESDVYDVWNNNFIKQGWSQPTYWTPAKTINNLLNNFRLVDVASNTNVDITEEWFELKIDNRILEEGALVLLKDQENPAENGIYVYQNRFLVLSNVFDDIVDRQYFSCYVKVGAVNADKQFFLERLPNGDYPYLSSTSGALFFEEGTNYVIRNRVDYKLLADNAYNDSVLHIDRNPILYDYERFDLSVIAGGYTYRVSKNANWIIRLEDNLDIGFNGYRCNEVEATTAGTNGIFEALSLGFRLNSDNDTLFYLNHESNLYNIYQLDPETNISACYYSTEQQITDFTFVNDNLYLLIGVDTIEVRDKNTLTLFDTYIISDIAITEFKVLDVDGTDWYYFITTDIVYQWHPDYGLDIISEEEARYLIVNLDDRTAIPEAVTTISAFNTTYPIEITGSQAVTEDKFGFSAALTDDKLVVSAPENNSGLVYLFSQGTNGLTEEDFVNASTSGNLDEFGYSVSIENNVVVVAAPNADSGQGKVSVYDISTNQFNLIDELSETGELIYGVKVLIKNNTIFVSAPLSSKIYVYEQSGTNTNWTLSQTLTSPIVDANQQYGISMDADNEFLVVGAPGANVDIGAVFVYQYTTSWNLITTLAKTDSIANELGITVAIYDAFIFAGAPVDSATGSNGSGSVYVFRKQTPTTWAQAAKIKPTDPTQTSTNFGASIFYDSEKLFVGAPSYDLLLYPESGAVYKFIEQGFNNWAEVEVVEAPSPKLTGQFGQSVVANNDIWFAGEINPSSINSDGLGRGYAFENVIVIPPEGTDGTSGLAEKYVQLSWVKQSDTYPIRIEKNTKYLTDYVNWEKESEFFIYDDFSKTEQGDWKIEDDTLKLKDVNILNQGTSGLATIPKVSNTNGRYFDGKDDFVQLPSLSFTDVIDATFEFAITPGVIKTNTRLIYLGSDRSAASYDSIEFIERDLTTGKPRFQIKDGDNFLIIDSTVDIPVNIRTRITVTIQMSNSTNPTQPYSFTARIWYDDILAGSNTGLFTKSIADLLPLTENYIAKSDDSQDPLYLGVIDEYRISSEVLNPAQIAARDVPIIDTDVTYNDLVYYWNLLDETSIMIEKIQNQDGIFSGGLATDPTLSLIEDPTQILFDQDENFLYILTQDKDFDLNDPFDYDQEILDDDDIEILDSDDDNIIGFTAPPVIESAIYRINLNTEDVEVVTDQNNILSIYIEDNTLYWLTYDAIYSVDENTPIVQNILGAIDFTVVFDKIFYIDRTFQIFDENKNLVFEAATTLDSVLMLFYGKYQTGTENWYNVYLKTEDERIFILASQFTMPGDMLELKGIYPFYLTDYPNSVKGIELNGKYYYITNTNRVIEVDGNDVTDLDPANKYWSWRLDTLFAINGYDEYLFVGAIKINGDVQVWRYDTNLRITLLLRKLDRTVFFNSENTILDLDVTNESDPRLIIIKENALDVENYKVGKNQESIATLENLIQVNPNGALTQLKSVTENSFLYVSILNDENYLGLVSNQSEYGYWKNVLEIDEVKHKIWIGDFGVALKDNGNQGTSDHTLDLLNTYVKFDFYEIELGIDRNINDENYIVPTWTGNTWIYGQNGESIISENYGDTWTPILTNTFSNLNNASYIDRNGLVVGKNATILETASEGIFFNQIDVPKDNIQNREFTDVLMYQDNRALIVGKSGLIMHLELIQGRWIISQNILNVEVDIVTQDDLDVLIKPVLTSSAEDSLLRTNYTKILYLNDSFWLFGDKGYIANLKLVFEDGYIKPLFVFYLDSLYNDVVVNAEEFVDFNDGLNKIVLTSENQFRLFARQGSSLVENSNLYSTVLDTINVESGGFKYKTSFIENNIQLYAAGYNGNIKDAELQDNILLEKIDPINFEDVDPILDEYFKPRMLIADYYLARKINILLREGNYIIPTTDVPKSILSCVNGVKPLFNEDEYVEWKTISNSGQPNYLAYQDWYYTTRRLTLLDGIDVQGLTKYFPYNKKFIAKDDLTNYSWEKTIPINSAYPPTGYNTILRNELWSNPPDFPESYYHTVIYVDGTFSVAAGDVIELKISRDAVNPGGVAYVALLLKDKFIVKDVDGNKIVLWDLLDPEILADFEPPLAAGYDAWTIRLENLNYFSGHISSKEDDVLLPTYNDSLKGKVERHFVGEAYQLIVNQPDIIIIEGIVNQDTKYSNLDAEIEFYTSGETADLRSREYQISYDEKVIYGPDYNLYEFLNRLDPKFTYDYDFNPIDFAGILNGRSGDNELSISRNLLYAGEDYIEDLLQFKEGTWVDISKGDTLVERVFIDNHQILTREDGSKRIRISFDTNLSDRFIGNINLILQIHSRFELGQISSDLEWTDNINFPTPATDGEVVEAGTNGTSALEFQFTGQKGSYYHGWNNYLRTATAYTKILADNEDIKSNISAVVWVDDENDLKLNVFNWTNDPNFAFRPIDLHIVGIDAAEDGLLEYFAENDEGTVEFVGESKKEFGLKRAISVLTTNWDIDDNFFGLKDIDLEKFNYILTDGLTLQRLNEEFFWILNANIRNAVIGLEDVAGEELLRWYQGDWICGTWENGRWYSGQVYSIKWLTGEWFTHPAVNNYNVWSIDYTINDKTLSIWLDGEWGSGIWHNGIWYNGVWYGGTHEAGDWFDGIWLNGEWQNGSWSGGSWFGGTWLDGVWNNNNVDSTWYNGTWLGGDFENGLWINGIWDQGAGKTSRFGTKSTSVQQSIWQFGIWKNGQFHNYLNLNEEGEPIASESYKYSMWFNGIWLAGNWYGGTWNSGRWENGIWHFGLWRSMQQLKYVELVQTEVEGEIYPDQSRLVFNNPHYYAVTTETLDYNDQTITNLSTKFVNRATIMGEPNVSSGDLSVLAAQLGWNSFPVDHAVDIVDKYTLLVKYFINGQYENRIFEEDIITIGGGTNGTDAAGTSGTAGFVICIDETLQISQPPIVDIYNTFEAYTSGPDVVSHWVDGTWMNGIWEYGYWGNGRWIGGVWLRGVWERGIFGA